LSRRLEKCMTLSDTQLSPPNQLANLLAGDLEEVNKLIQSYMESDYAPRIPEVTTHLVSAGGKRLRPILTLAAARMCGYQGSFHIHLAASVELIHTATLLHDDVVDESTRRRGKPTANLLWDNQSSVLVGDYLFSRAFQLMVKTKNLHILDILANASATIAEGEILQLTASKDIATTEDIYFKVIRGKTAALFAAAMEVGAVVADQDEKITEALREYGDALGITFQIVDDLLDYLGTEAIGKNIGDDFREQKLTLPVIKAISVATQSEQIFWKKCIGKGEQTDSDLKNALTIMSKHNSLELTRQQALSWSKKAKLALTQVPDSNLKKMLLDLADYVIERIN
jgi:octaprenyl-diphosphate synthase